MLFKVTAVSCLSMNGRETEVEMILKRYPCLKGWKYDGDGYITIDTLPDLLALQQLLGEKLIINDNELEIYDGYRE